MIDLDLVWSLPELAARADRAVPVVHRWLLRQLLRLPEAERRSFARKTAGKTGGWLINSAHPLVIAYLARPASPSDIAPQGDAPCPASPTP